MSGLWTGDGPINFTDYDNPDVNRPIEEALAQPTEEPAAPSGDDAHPRRARSRDQAEWLQRVLAAR